MTTSQYDRKRLSEVRTAQARTVEIQQIKAARTVEDHATDARDRAMLIEMLGLETQGLSTVARVAIQQRLLPST